MFEILKILDLKSPIGCFVYSLKFNPHPLGKCINVTSP